MVLLWDGCSQKWNGYFLNTFHYSTRNFENHPQPAPAYLVIYY